MNPNILIQYVSNFAEVAPKVRLVAGRRSVWYGSAKTPLLN